MAILSKPSFAPGAAIIYITVGALMDAWTAVYYFAFVGDHDIASSQLSFFWLTGFFLTGLILIIIGFALGPIGRSARQAEMPPAEVTPQVATAEMNAAKAPVIVPAATPANIQPVPAARV